MKLYPQLPNPIGLFRVNHSAFTHLDFLWAKDARLLVYNHVVDIIDSFHRGRWHEMSEMTIINALCGVNLQPRGCWFESQVMWRCSTMGYEWFLRSICDWYENLLYKVALLIEVLREWTVTAKVWWFLSRKGREGKNRVGESRPF